MLISGLRDLDGRLAAMGKQLPVFISRIAPKAGG
jgi:hypothetical protein